MFIRKTISAAAFGSAMMLAGAASAQPVTEDIYLSTSGSGVVGGVSYDDEDILLCDRSAGPGNCVWSIFFDGSIYGLGRREDVTAFHVLDDDHILLAFQTPKRIGGLKKVDDSDIVLFDRTEANPKDAYSFYFDGSDVGLTTDDESIDAIGFDDLGRLVVSTDGPYSVPMTGGGTLTGGDSDLIVFNGTLNVAATSGTWELFFDGSSAGLNTPQEDVGGAWFDLASGEIYLTARGAFSLGAITGDGADIFICDPADFDPVTSCDTASTFFIAMDEGLEDRMVDGIFIFNNTPPVAVDDSFTTDEDTVLSGENVLNANPTTADSDPDGDPLTVTAVNGVGASVGVQITLASGALLTLNSNGTFSYDPNGQFDSLAPGALIPTASATRSAMEMAASPRRRFRSPSPV